MAMGKFYLVIIARTDRNGGKCWAATKMHRLLGPREHRAVSGRSGGEEAQAASQHPGGTGRRRTEVGSSRVQSPAAGDRQNSASRLSFEMEKKGLLPAVPKQGWAGEGADELKARSCSLSLSQSDVKAEDPEYNAPAEAAELCR